MRSGTKLWSAVCETEVIVIRGGDIVVQCGGSPMVDHRESRPSQRDSVSPALAHGTKIGKRYVDDGHSVELLCVKAGEGSLSIGGVALQLKEAKPLPASD
jgi:hypothetical protein